MKFSCTLFVLFFLCISKIPACSCDEIDFTTKVQITEEICLGRLVTIQATKDFFMPYLYTFELDKKWKGTTDKIVTIADFNDSCATSFEVKDGKYILFLKAYERSFWDKLLLKKKYYTHYACIDPISEKNNWKKNPNFQKELQRLDQTFPIPIDIQTTLTSLNGVLSIGIWCIIFCVVTTIAYKFKF